MKTLPVYYEDLRGHQVFTSRGRTITEADIVGFAGLSGDFNPLHTDAEWVAANTEYARPIAHGLLVLAVSSGLRTEILDDLHILAYLDVQRRMAAPTYPGDTIRMRTEIIGLRESTSRPAGIVTLDITVANQRGETVQSGQDILLVGKRS